MGNDSITVAAYLKSLPEGRRTGVEAIRDVILANLPNGYVETISLGMIAFEVPLAIEPKTYNGKPLMYAALASQKNYISIYLCALYCVPGAELKFRQAWKGKKIDMGKACIRAKKLEDLDLDLIGKTIAATPVDEFARLSRK